MKRGGWAADQRLWGGTTVVSVALVCSLWLWIGSPAILGPWDVVALLGGGYRITLGQVPSTDFHNPIGPLTYWLVAAGMRLETTPSVAALEYGSIMFTVLMAAMTWGIARRRMAAFCAAALTVFSTIVMATPRALGYSYAQTTYAMTYNRFAWVTYAALLISVLFRVRRPPTPTRHMVQGFALGTLLSLLLYCKITYFVAGVAAVAVGLMLGTLPRRPELALGAVTALTAMIAIVELFLGFSLAGYVSDLAAAAQVQVGDRRLAKLLVSAFYNLVVLLLTVTIIAALIVAVRRRGASAVQLYRLAGAATYVIMSSLLLSAGNATERYELPALVVLPALIYSAVQLDDLRTPLVNSIATSRLAKLNMARVATIGAVVLFAATTVITVGKNALQTVQSIQLRHYVATAPQSQRIDSPGLRNFVVPEYAHYDTSYRTAHSVPSMINDGIGLLNRHIAPEDTVFTLGYTDPFSLPMGLRPLEGGLQWWDVGFDFDSRVHPTPEEATGEADWIMIPRLLPGQGCCPQTDQVLRALYLPYIDQHYAVVDVSSDWTLMQRTA